MRRPRLVYLYFHRFSEFCVVVEVVFFRAYGYQISPAAEPDQGLIERLVATSTRSSWLTFMDTPPTRIFSSENGRPRPE